MYEEQKLTPKRLATKISPPTETLRLRHAGAGVLDIERGILLDRD